MVFLSKTEELFKCRHCFAWFPVLLDDGRLVWLERYYERWFKGIMGRMYPKRSLDWIPEQTRPVGTPPPPNK